MLTKAGLRIRLVDMPFEQPVGERTLKEVWRRQDVKGKSGLDT